MPRVIFTHAVEDVAFWASKHSERVSAFAAWGNNVVDYLNPDGSKNVAVGVDVHDIAGMKKALADPAIAAAKKAHGVIDPVAVYIEK